MSKAGRTGFALIVALVMLAALAWFDVTVLREAEQRSRATFDTRDSALVGSLGSFAIAASVLGLAWLALRSRSVAVGVIYLVVGGFFALLPVILSSFATYRNDVPPLLPDPLARGVGDIYVAAVGPLNAVVIVGAGMVIAGAAVITRSFRERTGYPVPR